jgi:histone deacetylase complex subunit SAP30
MPPAKNRHHDDLKSEGTGKEKNGGHSSTKIRRVASQQGGSSLREVQNASTSAITQQPPAEAVAPSLQWSSFDRDVLHAYRRQYNLNTPTSFTCTFHQTVLTQASGIGIYSPTMLRRKKARQNKERLTMAVRKHFNDLGIQENDVIVDFICKLKNDEATRPDLPKRQNINTME